MTDADFYSSADKTTVNLENLKKHLLAEGRLSIQQALHIIKSTTAILKKEETLVEVEAPVTGT